MVANFNVEVCGAGGASLMFASRMGQWRRSNSRLSDQTSNQAEMRANPSSP